MIHDLEIRINQLKKEKDAVILAHYYQQPEIQDIADKVADSLDLSRYVQNCDHSLIVFAGVYFMGEVAKILAPDKKIIVPEVLAGCDLEKACQYEQFRSFIDTYPGHVVVSYINSSAEVKSLSDVVVTSSNAEKIINSLPEELPIIFAPDKNLGDFLIRKTGRKMLLWEGVCHVHESFDWKKISTLLQQDPSYRLVAHPECDPEVLELADFVGSTSNILNYVQQSRAAKFIVATEKGALHQAGRNMPEKQLVLAPPKTGHPNQQGICADMKMVTLEKIYLSLKKESYEVDLSDDLLRKARRPLHKMLALS